MSKNELLNAFENFLNDLEGSVQTMDEDAYRDLVHEEMLAVGVGPCFEDDLDDLVVDKVDEALGDYNFDRPIEAYLQECDFITRDDLDSYYFVNENDFDSYCGDWADSYLDDRIDNWADDCLGGRVEGLVTDAIQSWADYELSDAVDEVVNTYDWDVILSDSVVMEKIKKLEVKLAMYEVLEILDAVRG